MERWTAQELVSLWPRPRTTEHGSRSAVVSPSTRFTHTFGCCTDLLEQAADRARRHIFWAAPGERGSLPLPHLRVRAPDGQGSSPPERRACSRDPASRDPLPAFVELRLEVSAQQPTRLQLGVDESYELDLRRGSGVLRATTEWGALRGLESFAQLVQWTGSDYQICGLPLLIRDSPEWKWRGMLLDTARHFLPLDTAILPMLNAMEALKLNVLHLHLTDAHSFPFGSAALPELPAHGAMHPRLVYSLDDLRWLVEQARLRGIRVVPELDMPAHTAAWGHGRPDLTIACPRRVLEDEEGAEHGLNKVALHPLLEATYEAIESLLREMADVFPDEYVHLGGDEVDGECWLTHPDVRKWAGDWARQANRHGLNWKEQLQGTFTQRVARMAQRHGKRVILWDDAMEAVAAVGMKPASLTIAVWRDWVKSYHERRDQALLLGHDVIWASLTWYQDLPGNTWDVMYKVPLPKAQTMPPSFLGGQTCSWHEHGDAFNLQQRTIIRAAAVAERLWSGEPSALDVARQRLASLRCRLVHRGLLPSAVIPDYCEAPAQQHANAEEASAALPTLLRSSLTITDSQQVHTPHERPRFAEAHVKEKYVFHKQSDGVLRWSLRLNGLLLALSKIWKLWVQRCKQSTSSTDVAVPLRASRDSSCRSDAATSSRVCERPNVHASRRAREKVM